MTVTAGSTGTAATGCAIKVLVFTDSDGGTPTVGASVESGTSSSVPSFAQAFTAMRTGSLGVVAVTDWNALGAPTAGTGCTTTGGDSADQGTTLSYAVILRSTADGVAGASTTMNVTFGASTPEGCWVAFEVMPTNGGDYPNTRWTTAPGRVAPTGEFLPATPITDPASAAVVNASAEETTHTVVTDNPAPGIAVPDATAPAIGHTTSDATVTQTTAAADSANSHTTGSPAPSISITDGTAPAVSHTANPSTPGVSGTDGTAPALAHTTNAVTTTQTTTDSTAPANAHDTATPAPGVAVTADAGVISHTAYDATTSTATLLNVNAEETTHTHVTGDTTATLAITAEAASTSHNVPDASGALSLPAGTGGTSHTTTDALAALAVPDATAPALSHTTATTTLAVAVPTTEAATTHQAFDATTSTATLVNANAGETQHAVVAGDPAIKVDVSPETTATTHTTYDATASTSATVSASDASNTHTTHPATAGVGGQAQNVAHAFTTHDVTSTQTTLSEGVSVALVAFDATVSTYLQPPPSFSFDSASTWVSLDNARTVGTTFDSVATHAGSHEHVTTPDNTADGTTAFAGIVE